MPTVSIDAREWPLPALDYLGGSLVGVVVVREAWSIFFFFFAHNCQSNKAKIFVSYDLLYLYPVQHF